MSNSFQHIHHEEWLVSFGDRDLYHTEHGDEATAEREAAIARDNGTDAHPIRKRICLWADPFAESEVRGVDQKPLAEMIRPPAEDLKSIALLLRLIEFVDHEHEYAIDTCAPMPGKDCVYYCTACKLLADVPDNLLTQARADTAAAERTGTGR